MQEHEGVLRRVPAGQLLLGEIAHLRGNHEQAMAFLRPFLRDNPLHVQGAMVIPEKCPAVPMTTSLYLFLAFQVWGPQ